MRLQSSAVVRASAFLFTFTLLPGWSWAQVRAQDRLPRVINENTLAALRGNVSPKARPEFDHGRAPESLALERVTLVFKPAQAQQASLDRLLQQQQDPSSPNYHKWLTPQQYAEQFGLSQNDFNRVADWLQAQGLTVVDRAPSRNWIAFNGTAAQMAAALHTEIHQYVVNGQTHYANAGEPSLPTAIAGLVLGVRSLNDFRPRPRPSALIRRVRPNFTSGISGNHFLAPDDFATIYDLQSLYKNGTDGTGQSMAIVGQTDIVLSDIATFRSVSALPASVPQVILVPGSSDPGVLSSDIGEADLDIEWAGAVARKATIIYVNSKNGAFDSLQYAISRNVAPVVSTSYGDCEPNFSSAEIASLSSLFQQANVQGQTVVAATGDSGAADCDYSTSSTTTITSATHGLAVDVPASFPYVTGIGGTEFNEGSGTYWNTTNNSSNGSAISYIPEIVWNDTVLDGSLAAGGGGVSTLFSKPSWQTGTGVPADGKRDVPDVSFSASADHDGYLTCSQSSCVNGYRAADNTLTVVGGTSAGAPTFAGLVVLINQKTNSRQGNVNPKLYALAASSPDAFHDLTQGDNKVPCTTGTKDCPNGGTIGYSAAAGYDPASGLGSVDGFNLVNDWASSAAAADFQLTAASPSLTIARGSSGTDSLTLTALNSFSGTVSLSCTLSSTLAAASCSVSPNSVTASGTAKLTITVPTQFASLHRAAPLSNWGFGAESGLIFAVGLLFTGRKRPRDRKAWKRVVTGVLLALMLAALVAAVACGGSTAASSSNLASGSTPVSGTVTVQATSGSLSHSVAIALTVN